MLPSRPLRAPLRLAGAALALLAALSCGGAPPPSSSSPPPAAAAPCPPSAPSASSSAAAAPAPFPDAGERKALFDELVAAARKYHVFSEHPRKNLGWRWEDDLPALERAFAEAADLPALRDALSRFGNSLRDGHAGYSTGEPPGPIDLGLRLAAEWIQGAPRFHVAEVKDERLRASIKPGDIVTSANGVPGDRLLSAHMLRSRGTSFRRIADDVAGYLAARSTDASATCEGAEERWTFQHRDGGQIEARLTWRKSPPPPEAEEDEPEAKDGSLLYEATRCGPDLREPDYGPYKLTAKGKRVCLYTSDRAPYDAYPILRHYSFRYLGFFKGTVRPAYLNPPYQRDVIMDYHLLTKVLRQRPRTRGIILDLRDNFGGNPGEWFLDWYAPGPYLNIFTRIPQLPEYADPEFRKRVINLGDDEDWFPWYQRQLAATAPGAPVINTYNCPDPCGTERRLTPAHALVAAPVALLVGPTTGSAAAHFALIFDENDFGPLVGDITGASFTVFRLEHPVRTRRGLDLGTMTFALTSEISGKTGEPIEGRAPHIDYPIERTFERAAQWDADHVAAAIRSFKEYRFPKHATRLGP